MDFYGYHGTNLDNALKIKENGFEIRSNKMHWLGNGVYFFLDYDKAEYWAKHEKANFGCNNDFPAIVRAKISVERSKMIDTRDYNDYRKLSNLFKSFHKMAEILIEQYGGPDESVAWEMYRKSFFDWLHKQENYEVFIVGFYKAKQYAKEIDMRFKIPYIEYQVGVHNVELINIEDVCSLNSGGSML